VLSLLSAAQGSSGGVAHFAHLGGLLTGYLYLKADWRTGRQLERFKRGVARSRRLAIVPRDEEGEERTGLAANSGRREEAVLYDKVDAVLDKISAEGMSSLTRAELALLDEVSKRHRSN